MTNSLIHPTAIIADGASIADDVSIGPYSVIGENVELHKGVKIHEHVVVDGYTVVGEGTEIFPFASIGKIPQDLKYHGEKSRLIIGKNNKIREHSTMNPGTEDDRMETVVGDNCLFMIGTHVAHDCVVGNNVIMANNATLAGHVHVGDFAIIGGLSAVRQFARIGEHAMIGGMSGVENDVVPYGLVIGERAKLAGLNLVGLERRGFDKAEIKELRKAYGVVFGDQGVMRDRLDSAANDFKGNGLVSRLVEFAKVKTKVGLCQPRSS